ncbi:hypothetical protein GCM10012319_15970 [Comamonas sp. KCTC 72670]|nr:hypothetical protein GCM10012319_15970 [Comamonas sp. KCTC 72670]
MSRGGNDGPGVRGSHVGMSHVNGLFENDLQIQNGDISERDAPRHFLVVGIFAFVTQARRYKESERVLCAKTRRDAQDVSVRLVCDWRCK